MNLLGRTLPGWRIRAGLLLLALPGLLPAQTGAGEEISEFKVNGLKVLVKRRPSSQTVAVGLFFIGGRRNQTLQNAGLEQLCLNVTVAGSEKYPAAQLRRELAQTSMSLGSATNGDYSAVSLACTREQFGHGFDLLADAVLHPALAEAEFERQRAQLLAAVRNDADPDTQLQRIIGATIFSGHPYEVPEEGTPESLASLKVGDLRACQAQLLQTSRMLLVVVGNVNPGEVRRLATAAFGKLAVGEPWAAPVLLLSFAGPSLQRTVRALPTNYVEGVFGGPAAAADDLPALQIAVELLKSRLFAEIRVRHNLSYAPSAELLVRGASTGDISFTTTKISEVMPLVRQELKTLRETPQTADDLRSVQALQRTSLFTNTQTNAAQARRLAQFEITGGGWARSLDPGYEKVTPAQVQRAAQTWLKNFQFFVLGPDTSVTEKTFELP